MSEAFTDQLLLQALVHREVISRAVADAQRGRDLSLSDLGVLLVGEATGLTLPPWTALGYSRDCLLAICQDIGMPVSGDHPGSLLVAVVDRQQGAVFWLSPKHLELAQPS